MIFGPDNASASVASILTNISARSKTVQQILELVSRKLESTDIDGDKHMLNSQDFDDIDESDDDDDFEEDYFPGDEDILSKSFVTGHHSSTVGPFTESTADFRQRIRRDLLAAKNSGFKVGHLGGLMDGLGCYISISIRISKLGISEEAMRAWQVEPNEYLIMLFHYPAGYKSMDDYQSYDNARAQSSFAMRIGISKSYKPTLQEAVQAFTVLSKEDEKRQEESQETGSQAQTATHQGFRQSFISRPLNELFAQRFPMLLKYRYAAMDWNGAELFYNDQILQPMSRQTKGWDDKYHAPEAVSAAYPPLVTADHILESNSQEHSLPVVAMQFGLRHFVRCTEFCLICFSKMADDLQAIKPYVCDNPLCLYQYMSLGFGPSIDHEVLSQPKVVDLLISFCYSSARSSRLNTFPSGLALMVPPAASYEGDYQLHQYNGQMGMHVVPTPKPTAKSGGSLNATATATATAAKVNVDAREILFEDKNMLCPLRVYDWITFRFDDEPGKPFHCRVLETAYFPTIKISEPLEPAVATFDSPGRGYGYPAPQPSARPAPAANSKPRKPNEFHPAKFQIYNQNFDDLTDNNKQQIICLLLDLLPPVNIMKQHLLRTTHSSLSSWTDRLSPASLGLLRWIIASNRACIVQVDTESDVALGHKAQDRLYGMSSWHQFRFAMGAPDKERRFVQSVRSVADRLQLQHPTLFAWHGSPLHNWHSIIREGLHFKETHHGRAFGHGVYHSLDVHTSQGYSGYGMGSSWPNSELKVQQALALNEICNAPQEFVSRNPHLVVAQLDWIQTRYLFVYQLRRQTRVRCP
jgi:ubiquitin-conjugating enzyme E2 Q